MYHAGWVVAGCGHGVQNRRRFRFAFRDLNTVCRSACRLLELILATVHVVARIDNPPREYLFVAKVNCYHRAWLQDRISTRELSGWVSTYVENAHFVS